MPSVLFSKNNHLPEYLIGKTISNLSKVLITDFLLSPTCSSEVLTYYENTITIWSLTTGDQIATSSCSQGFIERVFWPTYGRIFIVHVNKTARTVRMVVFENNQFNLDTFEKRVVRKSSVLDCGMKGNLLVSVSPFLWEAWLVSEKKAFKHKCEGTKGEEMASVAVHPTLDHMAVASLNGKIRLWWHVEQNFANLKSSRRSQAVTTLHWHQGCPRAMLFSTTALFTGGSEATLVKWDLSALMGRSAAITKEKGNSRIGSSTSMLSRKFFTTPAAIEKLRWLTVERTQTENEIYVDSLKPHQYKLCLCLQDQSFTLVNTHLSLVKTECHFLQPPSLLGFKAPVLSPYFQESSCLYPDLLLMNGRTGRLQLFNWRSQIAVEEIECCEGQTYIPKNRGFDYCGVEVYRMALTKDGHYLATVEKLYDTKCDDKKSLTNDLATNFNMQKLRFYWHNEANQRFQLIDSHVMDSAILDMQFRSNPEQCFLLTESCELLLFERFIESGNLSRWLSMGLWPFFELGMDVFTSDIQMSNPLLTHASIDLSLSKRWKASDTLDRSTRSRTSETLLAIGCLQAVHCLTIRSNTTVDILMNASYHLSGDDWGGDEIKQVHWYPDSMHLLCLTCKGSLLVLEWRDNVRTAGSKHSPEFDDLQLVCQLTLPGCSLDPVDLFALHSPSLQLALVTKTNRLFVVHWSKPVEIQLLEQVDLSSVHSNLTAASSVTFVWDKRMREGAEVTLSQNTINSGKWTIAIGYSHAVAVLSTLDCDRIPEVAAEENSAKLVSRGTKRLQELLSSVKNDNKRRRLDDDASLLGYWPLARKEWQELASASPGSMAAHPSTWLKRLLVAELNTYTQSRGGNI